MTALVVYDSVYGNTEKIAKAIGGGIGGEVQVVRATDAASLDLKSFGLVVVGAPTYGGKPTETMQGFLGKISETSMKGVKVATFDTRLSGRFVRMFGFAAEKIGTSLQAKGGVLVMSPEGFFVKGREGPLKEGEVERALAWGRALAGKST